MDFRNTKAAGTLLVIGASQFILAVIIAEAVYPNYSISTNYISDLGIWSKPSAAIFNTATIFFGLTALISAYLLKRQLSSRWFPVFLALSGAGGLGVGIFPADTFVVQGTPVIHSTAAFLAFVFGGIAAITAYKVTKPPFAYLSVILGATTLIAFVLLLTTRDFGALGIGAGGLERMVAYPSLLWTLGYGGYLLGAASNK